MRVASRARSSLLIMVCCGAFWLSVDARHVVPPSEECRSPVVDEGGIVEGAPALSLLQVEAALQAQTLLQASAQSKAAHGTLLTAGTSWTTSDRHHVLRQLADKPPARVAAMLGMSLCVPIVLVVALTCEGTDLDKARESKRRVPSAVSQDWGGETQGSESDMSIDAMAPPSPGTVLFYAVGCCIAGSVLTIINQVALNAFKPPVSLTLPSGATGESYIFTLATFQFSFASGFTWMLGATGKAEVTPLKMKKLISFFPAAGILMVMVVAGNAVMHFSSVNTRLVLAAIVPVPCSLLEMWIYGDQCPPFLGWAGMLITVFGALAYSTLTDGFSTESVSWAVLFMVITPVSALVKKHCISVTNLTQWGLVYYNSTLAALTALVFAIIFELPSLVALAGLRTALSDPSTCFVVALACAGAVALNFFQLTCIHYISATAKSVLGVAASFFTLFLNILFLREEEHDTMVNLCVVVALLGALLWQQSVEARLVRPRSKIKTGLSAVLPVMAVLAALVWMGIVNHRANRERALEAAVALQY